MFISSDVKREQFERKLAARAAQQPKPEDKKTPLYMERPEPRYEVSTDASGNAVSTEAAQSPFTPQQIKLMRSNSILLAQLQRGRAEDMRAHKSYMLQAGPALEQKYSCSARAIFRQGDSKQGSRIYSLSPDDYAMLREYSYWL